MEGWKEEKGKAGQKEIRKGRRAEEKKRNRDMKIYEGIGICRYVEI